MRPLQGGVIAVAIAALPLSAEVFLSPQIEAALGFDSNRYQVDGDDGAAFAAATPSLDVTGFVFQTVELNATVLYALREFLREGFSRQSHTSGSIGVWYAEAAWEGGMALGGSWASDEAIPESDLTRRGLSTVLAYNDLAGRRYDISSSLECIVYDETELNEASVVRGTYWNLRPTVRIPARPGVSVWGAPVFEDFSSNSATRDYRGYGLGLGVDYAPPAPVRAGVSLQAGVRHYANPSGDSPSGDNVSVLSARVWGSVRFSAATEIFSDLQGGTFWSDDAAADYARWEWRAGLRLRHDAEMGSRLR